MRVLVNVCDAGMPRKGKGSGRSSMYWWNEVIAKCCKLRRIPQRRRNGQEAENIQAAFKSKRKELRKAIKDSKK